MLKFRGVFILVFLAAGVLFLAGCASQHVRSAKIYMQDEDWDNAREVLENGRELTPDDPELFYLLGKVYVELEEWEKMNQSFKRVRELTDAYDVDISATLHDAWRQNFNQGVKPFNKGDYEKALEKFNVALMIRPGDHETIKQIALCKLALGEKDEAEQLLLEAVESEADTAKDVASRINLLNLYWERQDWESAIKWAESILEIEPNRADVVDKIALAYQQMNEDEKAIVAWEDVLELNPDNPDYHFNKAMVHYRLEQWEQAEEGYRRTIELNPDDEEAFSFLVNTLLRKTDWAGLVKLLEPRLFPDGEVKELESPGGDIKMWKVLRAAYANQEEVEKAVIVTKIVEKLEPEAE